MLDLALADGSAAKRFGGRVLNVTWARDLHAKSVATEVAKIAVGERNKRNGGQETGRGRDYPTQETPGVEGSGGVQPHSWIR